ncbi:uncharacterized protein EV154DRAFT_425564 [Mucor mucedo]|uniref:uncharacterized protein n=1 Tax=Mucor mucedo TaxID=29922 RepID=UPI0022205ED5|nr:uncharacterized protein EV154DRAFT_425564 [Mucor mucedo]KAI7888571.1 hypothetical protein EV154DRAFT_425564 [Mucor mucedo]
MENDENRRLHNILSSPEQLAYFETYLQGIHAHENLLFIEALSELQHEKISKNIEIIVHRIWKTFLTFDSPLELNVKSKERIDSFFHAHKWQVISKTDAQDVLKDAEVEVKIFLNEKIIEFDKIHSFERIFHAPTCNKYQKRVVIIGGGFTGFTVASILDPMPRFHVTLIDTKDSFEYTPGMIKLLVRPEETSSLRVRHDAYVKEGRVIIGYAEKVVEDAKSVKVNNEYVPLDYLVIATGSTYMSKLKSFDTSSLYRLSELAAEHNALKQSKSVLIIGSGGLVGCELASEIATHVYPSPYQKKKRITIVDSHSNLVRRSSEKRQANALNYLKGLGVEVVLNEKIVDFDSGDTNSYLGSSGCCYAGYDKVFMATGTTPCSEIFQGDGDVGFESSVDHWGKVRVKKTLQLDHYKFKHIFAGGDVTNVTEEKTGYAATLAGVCIARNICRLEKNKAPLNQGSKGTLPAPSKPLHGIESRGGVGRQNLNSLKRTFAFLNPSWAALKYFDEQEFLNIVQGEAKLSTTAAIGRKPKVLNLPEKFYKNADSSSSSSVYSVGSIFKQQTNHQQTHSKSSDSTGTETSVRISAKNLSGSDIISTNINEAAGIAFSNCTCGMTQTKQHTSDQSHVVEDLAWPQVELKPRPLTPTI